MPPSEADGGKGKPPKRSPLPAAAIPAVTEGGPSSSLVDTAASNGADSSAVLEPLKGVEELTVKEKKEWHRTVILPSHVLEEPPSLTGGLTREEERAHRVWGCELCAEAGILLRCPQVVMCTAQTILQRFFYRKGLHRFDAFSAAMGCTLLATKIEECPKRTREVVLVFHRLYQRRRGLPLIPLIVPSVVYDELKRAMTVTEKHVLKELGFGFYNIMDHPHKFILYYVKILDLEENAIQTAWNYLNDSLRTDLCLRYRAEVIACAAIYLASRVLQIALPSSPPWWELFSADFEEMGVICNTILALYVTKEEEEEEEGKEKKTGESDAVEGTAATRTSRKAKWIEPLAEYSIFKDGSKMRRVEDREREEREEKSQAVAAAVTAAAATATTAAAAVTVAAAGNAVCAAPQSTEDNSKVKVAAGGTGDRIAANTASTPPAAEAGVRNGPSPQPSLHAAAEARKAEGSGGGGGRGRKEEEKALPARGEGETPKTGEGVSSPSDRVKEGRKERTGGDGEGGSRRMDDGEGEGGGRQQQQQEQQASEEQK